MAAAAAMHHWPAAAPVAMSASAPTTTMASVWAAAPSPAPAAAAAAAPASTCIAAAPVATGGTWLPPPPSPLIASAIRLADVRTDTDAVVTALVDGVSGANLTGSAKGARGALSLLPDASEAPSPAVYARLLAPAADRIIAAGASQHGWPTNVVAHALSAYIALAGVARDAGRGKVVLDELLADAVTGKADHDSRADTLAAVALSPASTSAPVPREDVGRAWVGRWQRYEVVLRGDAVAGADDVTWAASLFRDAAPRILIKSKKVQGKRHVTFIANLAMYGIDASAFAREVSRKCAASASVITAAEAGVSFGASAGGGGKGDAPVVQVLGNDVDAIASELTEAWGLPSDCVQTGEPPPKSRGKPAGGAAGHGGGSRGRK